MTAKSETRKLYAHLNIRVDSRGSEPRAWVALTPCAMNAEDGQARFFGASPYGGEDSYYDGHFMGGICCQVFVMPRHEPNYSEVGFSTYGQIVKAEEAKQISKTLAWVERRTDKITQERGYAKNVAQELARFCEAIGATAIVTPDETTARPGRWGTLYDWTERTDFEAAIVETLEKAKQRVSRGY